MGYRITPRNLALVVACVVGAGLLAVGIVRVFDGNLVVAFVAAAIWMTALRIFVRPDL
jgi:hypothetical protein